MSWNCKLYKGQNILRMYALDSSILHFPMIYPALEIYKFNPLLRKKQNISIFWDGKEPAHFYYKSCKPIFKEWKLEVYSTLHESLSETDHRYFKTPIIITKFKAIKIEGE